jgi:hypothetical protein
MRRRSSSSEQGVNEMRKDECDFFYTEKSSNDASGKINLCSLKRPKQRDSQKHGETVAKIMTCMCMKRGCRNPLVNWEQ